MRIPIFYNPLKKKRFHLHVEERYMSKMKIIPLGCDCHPAYVLQKLHIRKHSLPFDWLNNSSLKSIEYVNDNFSNNFEFFLKDLTLNAKENVISKNYSYCEFLHEPKLIENKDDRIKFKRRIDRILDLKQKNPIHYINNITSHSINSTDNIHYFLNSVKKFASIHLKKDDKLSIYIRFDDSYEENKHFTTELEDRLNEINNVSCIKYIREQKNYPTWGNPKHYPKLLKDLGIEIYKTNPKIYIKSSF